MIVFKGCFKETGLQGKRIENRKIRERLGRMSQGKLVLFLLKLLIHPSLPYIQLSSIQFGSYNQ